MKKLTILILTHNRLEYTRFCLEAVKRYTDFSLIKDVVIGDAESIDGTEELVKTFDFGKTVKTVYKIHAGNIGLNLGTGAKYAKGDYIIIIGSDILVAPDYTEKALTTIQLARKHGINIVAYDDAAYRLNFYGEPILLDNGITLKRSRNVGGLVIIPREKMLLRGGRGHYLGDAKTLYNGWQGWYRAFPRELAMMFPRLGCFDMLRIVTNPKGFEYIEYRKKEPLVQELIKADPIMLNKKYIRNRWGRGHSLDRKRD